MKVVLLTIMNSIMEKDINNDIDDDSISSDIDYNNDDDPETIIIVR